MDDSETRSYEIMKRANALGILVELRGHVEELNDGLSTILAIEDNERVDLEISKVEVGVNAGDEVDEDLALLSIVDDFSVVNHDPLHTLVKLLTPLIIGRHTPGRRRHLRRTKAKDTASPAPHAPYARGHNHGPKPLVRERARHTGQLLLPSPPQCTCPRCSATLLEKLGNELGVTLAPREADARRAREELLPGDARGGVSGVANAVVPKAN
ncbi:hypothetical protein DFH11DRAFT_1549645 [Phellopilus nigrolimitatus]|nr:hypothetical protein DFH11DRAFT_1549645 [Phellopilus nigrolimitatus]